MQRELTNLLAALKAIHWYAWNIHWNATGPQFYSDHLLFERLYQEGPPNIVEQIDGLAERIIGTGHQVDAFVIDRRSNDLLQKVKGMKPVEGALVLENLFARLASKAIGKLDGTDPKSVTLDNYIRTLVDERSAAVYLLQQRLEPSGAYGDLGGLVGSAVSGGLSSVLLSAAIGAGAAYALVKYGDKLPQGFRPPHWELKPAIQKGAIIGAGLGGLSFVAGFTRGAGQAASIKGMIEGA
jgi:hypothetical protein